MNLIKPHYIHTNLCIMCVGFGFLDLTKKRTILDYTRYLLRSSEPLAYNLILPVFL